MKKTISINIRGIVFQIDEDAYEKLYAYLATLRRHFEHTQGKEEILEDIETRISELLQENLQDNKQVISIEDIERIIAILGQPIDFEESDEGDQKSEDQYLHGTKRLYRDPDHQILGGVCSGLGAYFRVDPLWFRLMFIVFLFVWGTGVLAYLILWAVVPKANTTAEKLEMRGEKVTVENIEKSIREEFEHIRSKLQDLTGQTKEQFKKKAVSPGNVIERFLLILLDGLKLVVRVLVIILGIALLLTGLGMLAAFITLLFGFEGIFFTDHYEVVNLPFQTLFYFINPSGQSYGFFYLGIILLISVPLIMLIYNAARMIFRFERIRYLGLTAFNIWLAGLIIVGIYAFRTARNFQFEQQTETEFSIVQPVGDTLHLGLKSQMPEAIVEGKDVLMIADDLEVALTNGKKYIGEIDLETTKSQDNEYHLIMYVKARGRNYSAALENASAVTYDFESTEKSILLANYYVLPDSIPWTKHEVTIEIQVPEGKEIKLDKNLIKINDRMGSRIRIRTFRHTSAIHQTIWESKFNRPFLTGITHRTHFIRQALLK